MTTCHLTLFSQAGRSETLYVDLTEIKNDSHPDSNYLQAPFDFDTRFSQIDSVRLKLLMPSGFGTALTTGNSTYISYLGAIIHGEGFELDISEALSNGFQSIPPLPRGSETSLKSYVFVPPNQKMEIGFAKPIRGAPGGELIILSEGEIVPHLDSFWPNFLHAGRGFVTLQAVETSSYHPLNPSGDMSEYSFTQSFNNPPPVEFAQLVVEGTIVPEPGTITMVPWTFIGCVTLLRSYQRSCRTRKSVTPSSQSVNRSIKAPGESTPR